MIKGYRVCSTKSEFIYSVRDANFPSVTSGTKKKKQWYNIPAAFDIETTSFYKGDEKRACMYIWQMDIDGLIFFGRTWKEFTDICLALSAFLHLDPDSNRLVIYVHNLAYEFQFMKNWLNFTKVFAMDVRKPLYAICDLGIEFRCSYLLSGYSLETLGKNLVKYPVEKMTGDLDYSLMRHSGTAMTEKEMGYCLHDVLVVEHYIQEEIENNGGIDKIPLTKTGYVRRYCREATIDNEDPSVKWNYRDLVKHLSMTPEEYKIMQEAFSGGFTHGDPFYVGQTVEQITSYDFCSSYPATMVSSNGFPMSKGIRINDISEKQFKHDIELYCCVFRVRFEGLKSKVFFENYLSISRCRNVTGEVCFNGRVVKADVLETTVTEQDWYIIRKCYEWDGFQVSSFYRYNRGYLPTPFVKAVLDLYQKKTSLKGVQGKEQEYLVSKGMLNSCYGMCVFNPIRPEWNFENGQWPESPVLPDLKEAIEKYNKSFSRFISYPWGLYVAAISRARLWSGILECGYDYVYSDTDSIKIRNKEQHEGYIHKYNDAIRHDLEKAMKFHNLPFELCEPVTIKGKKKLLGVWEEEGTYTKFKTLGSKRYLTEKDGNLEMTVAGLGKRSGCAYLKTKKDPFEAFNMSLYVPPESTGKNIHTYIDNPISGEITDYLGVSGAYEEKSYIHLEATDYSASFAREFIDYINEVHDENEIL